jgi:hypothetical protein
MYFYFDYFDYIIEFANSGNMGKYTIHEALGGTIYTTSYIVTIVLGLGLMVFMRTMKSIRDKKGEDI